MTTTLEMLYRDSPDSDAYTVARREKVEEIAEYIAEHLRPGLDAVHFAAAIMSSAEEMGRIVGDTVSGELSWRHTASHAPLPLMI